MADVSRLPVPVVAHWDWQRHAACRDMDLETFFHPEGERDPARSRRVARARAICAGCPVQAACRGWAHRVEEPYGIWGGESEDERRAALRRRRSPRTAA
ncbi:WhiB family transcriptional regulator [Actinomycetospora sp. TBRC 11914]|uniref:WhiB family transcriptional regulator n=1 Tax=Actinomycetospora sp. TBRC 11914 TaxID=2729387 RepID=UPI00145D0C7E|nr:WhiB family transcriptional regulator [Actinomycetospora sp. TBRC 11914]NMO93191.1 WhiB family transcriptional regulator [Actinomycetospora sp. TBRC 11914]